MANFKILTFTFTYKPKFTSKKRSNLVKDGLIRPAMTDLCGNNISVAPITVQTVSFTDLSFNLKFTKKRHFRQSQGWIKLGMIPFNSPGFKGIKKRPKNGRIQSRMVLSDSPWPIYLKTTPRSPQMQSITLSFKQFNFNLNFTKKTAKLGLD